MGVAPASVVLLVAADFPRSSCGKELFVITLRGRVTKRDFFLSRR